VNRAESQSNSALLNISFQQEPGANGTEIFNGIQYVRPGNGFVPNFKLFNKIEVNGDKEEPLYTFLKVLFLSFTKSQFLNISKNIDILSLVGLLRKTLTQLCMVNGCWYFLLNYEHFSQNLEPQ
jgi:glutathione peroxidase